MGAEWPQYPAEVSDGDEPSHSPNKSQNSLLATERGNDFTRRLETDTASNLFVSIAAIDASLFVPSSVSPLASGSATNVPASTLTTLVTYTAVAPARLTRISVSGTDYGKFQLFKNTVLIETKRSSPERSVDFLFTSPLSLASSDILDVKVTHYATGVLADFESTIYGA